MDATQQTVKPAPDKICCVCKLPIRGGTMVGMGSGSGDLFGHSDCYWRTRAQDLEHQLHEWERKWRAVKALVEQES